MKPWRFTILIFIAVTLLGIPRAFAAGWSPLSAKEITAFAAELSKAKVANISVHYEPEEVAFARSLVAVAKTLNLPQSRNPEARPETWIVVAGIADDPAVTKTFDLLKKRFPAGSVKFLGYKFLPGVLTYGSVDVFVGAKPQ